MSNYVQSTNFATKDSLPSGDPLKIVKGTEINTEFVNIAIAVATKADTNGYTNNGVVYASGSGILTNGSNLAFDGTNLSVNGTGSFSSSLVSSSSTLTDKPTFELRKTTNVTSGQVNTVGYISFNGKWGSTAGEQGYISLVSTNSGGLLDSNVLKLGTRSIYGSGAAGAYVQIGGTSARIDDSNGTYISVNNSNISYAATTHSFSGDADFTSALTVSSVPVVTTTGTQTLTNKTLGSGLVMAASAITSGTAISTTSGTTADFTSIPSWVKRITVMLTDVSTNGTSPIIVQLFTSTGVIVTGYVGATTVTQNTSGTNGANTSGFFLNPSSSFGGASQKYSGSATITRITGNTWVFSGVFCAPVVPYTFVVAGYTALSGTLTGVRFTTENGTDAFDDGSVNILYE